MKKPVPKTPEERSETEEIILDNFCGCCSSSDCTGLIPSDPTSETAADEYRNVYPYAVPDSDGVPYTKNKKKDLRERGYTRRCVNIKRLSAYACRQPLFTSYFQVRLSPYRVTVRPHTQL